MVEINSETDFAAKDAGFIAFADEVAAFIANNKINNTEEFLNTFRSSVELRLESDVPVANFASGGLDSTSIIKAQNDLKNRVT